MRRLWWRLLDRLFPRYSVGVDPVTTNSIGAVVVMQRKRDGTLWLKSTDFGYDEQEEAPCEGSSLS